MSNFTTLKKSDIRELTGDHLYVINTSDLDGRESRTELLMTFYINGIGKTVVVPSTWIPIDLTSFSVTVEMIKGNQDFWHFVNRKALAVISQEVAEEELDSEDAQNEYNRVYDIGRNKDSVDEEEEETHNMEDRMRSQKPLSKGNLRKNMASPKVMSILSKESLPEGQKVSALKNIENELKSDDLKYIIRNSANNERLKQWASNKLANS